MAQLLGKRKARPADTASTADKEDAEAIFRRHFEAQFRPLEVAPPRPKGASARERNGGEADSEREDSEWDGFSGEDGSGDVDGSDDSDLEELNQVEVVDHASSETRNSAPSSMMAKREMKAYMSSRPPPDSTAERSKSSHANPSRSAEHDDGGGQDEDSATLLANDLALQRLISESKILSEHASFGASTFSSAMGTTATASTASKASSTGGSAQQRSRGFQEGRLRRATTDMRLRALGGRESVLAQDRMPMAMRKGIEGAAAQREARRRREAKENGIVLERDAKGKNGKKNSRSSGRSGGRDQGVDSPGVGKMRGAELRLSGRDIRSIEGPGDSKFASKKRKRR